MAALSTCPKCGKRVSGEKRSGSLTAYLFGGADCNCASAGQRAATDDDTDFCPKCGLKLVEEERPGSLTAFLFQSTRCKCRPDQAFADGQMRARFWKLKQVDGGTIYGGSGADPRRAGAGSIDLVSGAIIGGAYEIIQPLGQGGMGEVYLARHEMLGKKCALKVIPPEQVTEMGWLRFQLEARAVAKLDHINLVRVTDLGIHEGCLPFYAMDYVQGRNLAEMLAEHGPMPLKTLLDIFMQVCDGVECAHRSGILHRDLKPANIMLVEGKGGLKQAKVLDFGLAKLTSHDRSKQSLTAVGDVFGSPYYMSPEQCNGEKIDNRSDIYSIGCTMFECLTGQPPFTGILASAVMFSHQEADPPSLESIDPSRKFPPSMEVVMAKLLRKNPVERYQTLSELKADLERVAAGQDVQPFYVSGAKRSAPTKAEADAAATAAANAAIIAAAKSPALPVLISFAVVALLLLGGGALLVSRLNHPPAKAAAKKAVPGNDELINFVVTLGTLKNAGCTEKEIDYVRNFDFLGGQQDEIRDVSRLRKYLSDHLPQHDHFLNQDRTVFSFPPEIFIGHVRFGDSLPVRALGLVKVPDSKDICFYQYNNLKTLPEFLDMFHPDDLTGLELVQTRAREPIAKIKNWTRLKKLSFFNSLEKALPGWDQRDQSNLQDKDLLAIDAFKGLETLGLSGQYVTGGKVAEMKIIRTIKCLRLKQISNVDDVLKVFPELDNLREVWLCGMDISDQQLQYLAKMKNLESLRLRRSKLTPNSLETLRKMGSLKHLYLDRNWDSNTKAQFKEALPFVKFESVLAQSYWPDEKPNGEE